MTSPPDFDVDKYLESMLRFTAHGVFKDPDPIAVQWILWGGMVGVQTVLSTFARLSTEPDAS